MRLTGIAIAGSVLGAANAQSTVSELEGCCQSIAASFRAPHTTVNFANYVSAGTRLTLGPPYNGSCGTPSQVVTSDICRVSLNVSTSYRSGLAMEAWLPTNWTGRFLSAGNGGVGGCIQYGDLDYTASLGFAAVDTNNGHDGMTLESAYNNPDVITDFVWRAMYTGVLVGKDLTRHYYRKDFTHSYYFGCSTGGRQGWKMVQDFPDLFDGVVVGAPALAFNNLSSWSGHFLLLTGTPESASYLPYDKWLLVHQSILDQCDVIDGVQDGVVEDPLLCDYIPEVLQCSPYTTNTTSCLTAAQVETVRGVFAPYYGVGGSLIFPAMQPGSEELAYYFYYNGMPFSYTEEWFRYAILNDPTWSAFELTPWLAAYAHDKNPAGAETWKGDLSAFRARGGKVIHYHGQQDWIISSDNSPRYYQHVSNTMGLPPPDIDEFYRFFRVSGMGHCFGGPGAWQIGQAEGNPFRDPQHNVILRIVDWVENGNAPETITGVKFVDDNATLGVDIVRDHCKYPKRNFCVDPANYKQPDAWKCI